MLRITHQETHTGRDYGSFDYLLGVYEKKYFIKADDCLFLDNLSYNPAFLRIKSVNSSCLPKHVIGVNKLNRRLLELLAISINLWAVQTNLCLEVCSTNSLSAYNIAKKKFNNVGIDATNNPEGNLW